ncbi:hypothetical protein ACFPOI_00920 [Nonomuraea angiospora]|uniref:SH3 domain-containing protein n=1 Tax=Nonomuraea angiospora TaxID=46172 RepID=A0ABR9M252_9ACTN|nr:hypothetical protein [Nonomuraea angiospora]MBE1586966.1 hypothetical protein [Nonomuraea angiospora]
MIISKARLTTTLTALVLVSGAALAIAPAAGAATTTTTTAEAAAAAVICPYKTLRATQRYVSATSSSFRGAWAKGATLGVYQGSASNGRLETTSGYWVKVADVASAGQCYY